MCKKCGGPTDGYKCSGCGEESETRDEKHACGPNYCVPKCTNCSEAETKCTCPVPVAQ